MRDQLRVGIIGVGNCASSLVQGCSYYNRPGPGLLNWAIGGYHPVDVIFSSAFDVDERKVGVPLWQAISCGQNNTYQMIEPHRIRNATCTVSRAPVLDGIASTTADLIEVAGDQPRDTTEVRLEISRILKESGTEILVNYLPVGSREATLFWAATASNLGIAFVNCIPEFIASHDNYWNERFRDSNAPLIGDDVKSQVGATIVHRVLAHLFEQRGIRLLRTFQLNYGGNMDFMNMKDTSRLSSKRKSKSEAVQSELVNRLGPEDIHIGPSDFVSWLEDRKWADIRLEAESFGGAPLSIELKLKVWDSPNSAGVVIDLIRYAKVALNHGISGRLEEVCSVYMKSPYIQEHDTEAMERLEKWMMGLGEETIPVLSTPRMEEPAEAHTGT